MGRAVSASMQLVIPALFCEESEDPWIELPLLLYSFNTLATREKAPGIGPQAPWRRVFGCSSCISSQVWSRVWHPTYQHRPNGVSCMSQLRWQCDGAPDLVVVMCQQLLWTHLLATGRLLGQSDIYYSSKAATCICATHVTLQPQQSGEKIPHPTTSWHLLLD